MNGTQLACLALGLAALLLGGAALWEQHKTRCTLRILSQMLDTAIDGSFTEQTFDESTLSAVESRMNRYLSASAVSARNLSAEKAKIQELLADISHQTKTPIANILLYAGLLSEQELSPAGRESAQALMAQAEKLRFLITALVKLSRLETGVLTLHPAPNTVWPLLRAVCEQMMPKAREKAQSLALIPTESTAVFDTKWTAEALANLVDNAVKYTPAGGKILLTATAYEQFCRIDVADTGIGIAEAEQAKIFTRFYRSPSVSDAEGVGIGLYLTRQILTDEGGYIKVSSAPGQGSTFSMFLPRGQ